MSQEIDNACKEFLAEIEHISKGKTYSNWTDLNERVEQLYALIQGICSDTAREIIDHLRLRAGLSIESKDDIESIKALLLLHGCLSRKHLKVMLESRRPKAFDEDHSVAS